MMKKPLVLLAVVIALLSCCADSYALDEQSIDVNGVDFYCNLTSFTMNANSSESFDVAIFNNSTSKMWVKIESSSADDRITVNGSFDSVLDSGDTSIITLTIHADKYSPSHHAVLNIPLKVKDTASSSSPWFEGVLTVDVSVSSSYVSEDRFNKILGIIPSPLNDSLNTPLINVSITAVLWVFIGVVVIALTRWFLHYIPESRKMDVPKRDLVWVEWLCLLFLTIFGITNCMNVYGLDGDIVGTFVDFSEIAIYAITAGLIWKIYKVFVYAVVVKHDKEDKIDDSLVPLLNMIGGIVIAVFTLSIILSILGLSLATILTSAGLVTLGISLGAQSTMNQFFCGIILMTSRPFRIGDKIKLEAGGEVLIVRKISVMETEFKNWLNEEIVRIPNSTVMGSTIINITRDDKTYKIYDYFDISYDSDIEKAKNIIMDTILSHPQVIKDGSKDKPSFRFYSMEGSSLRLRATYVIGDHENHVAVSGQVKEAVFRRFRAEGIEVPYNVVDVHVRS